MHRRTLLLAATCAVSVAAAALPLPSPDRLAELARDLVGHVAGRTVAIPGGGEVAVPSILPPSRIAECVATISEADAWPSTWLVVQDASRDYDLLLQVRLDENGRVLDPDPLLAAPRREWEAATIEAAVRKATGRKAPREKNVVVQSFRSRTETTYVYEPAGAELEKQGLLALLPRGSLIRDARRVDLSDGKLHTLALVLVEARFLPSDCTSCASRATGHVDTGTVLVVLAGEKALEFTLDLTPSYRERGAEPLVPRYVCAPGDEKAPSAGESVSSRFRERTPVPLLTLDEKAGTERRFALPLRTDCEHRSSLELAVSLDPPRIRVTGTTP